MKIQIENYRGFDIEFDTEYEKFQCIVTDENAKESVSFAVIKKFIDDYKKNNQDFNPFWIEPTPNFYHSKEGKLKVIGIRKDGRFVAEDENGKQSQISDYNLKDYMIFTPENKIGLGLLKELKIKEHQQELENNFERKHIISMLNIVTLDDFKKAL